MSGWRRCWVCRISEPVPACPPSSCCRWGWRGPSAPRRCIGRGSGYKLPLRHKPTGLCWTQSAHWKKGIHLILVWSEQSQRLSLDLKPGPNHRQIRGGGRMRRPCTVYMWQNKQWSTNHLADKIQTNPQQLTQLTDRHTTPTWAHSGLSMGVKRLLDIVTPPLIPIPPSRPPDEGEEERKRPQIYIIFLAHPGLITFSLSRTHLMNPGWTLFKSRLTFSGFPLTKLHPYLDAINYAYIQWTLTL